VLEHVDTSSKICNVAFYSKKYTVDFITRSSKRGEEAVAYKFFVDPFLCTDAFGSMRKATLSNYPLPVAAKLARLSLWYSPCYLDGGFDTRSNSDLEIIIMMHRSVVGK
jgi:hypothetical protein